MFIRNPYNIVVKYYRLINFLLIVPLVYLILKFGDIATFFRDYVSMSYSTPETNFVNSYITGLTFFALFITALIDFILYFLFLTKKKKQSYYIINGVYNLALIVFAMFFRNAMSNIQNGVMDPTFANFVRDCANLCYLPLYAFVVLLASKGFGFNFKTLKFDAQNELKISDDEDEENIELRLGKEDNSLKKQFIHLIRELKYYILENKFVFTCFSVVLLLIIVIALFLQFQVYNKTYSSNQAFSLSNFTLSLKDSYITNVDYRGDIITPNKYYLAIKIGIINNGQAMAIDKSNFRITVGDEDIYPNYDKVFRFLDIGKPYQGEILPHNDKDNPGEEYVLVYELKENQIRGNYQIRILNDLTQKEGKLVTRYKNINIKPNNIIKQENIGQTKTNTEINLKGTILGNSLFTLKNIEIKTSYPYEYESCSNNVCTTTKDVIVPRGGYALAIIQDELKLDDTTSYYKNSEKDFYEDFVSLSYDYSISGGLRPDDTKHSVTKLQKVSQSGLKDVKIYEVPSNVLYNTKLDFIIKIRNKEVVISVN